MAVGHEITVYFDGACPRCSREVLLYRRLDRARRIHWHDVCDARHAFDDAAVTREDALRLLHVRVVGGALHIGLDAHLAMWARLPSLRWLARCLRGGPLRQVAERYYRTFTAQRTGLVRTTKAAAHA